MLFDIQPEQTALPSQIAMTIDEVAAARAFETEDYIVVAAVVKNVYSSSGRNAVKDKIKSTIETAFPQSGKTVIVTYDLEVFCRIEGADQSELDNLLALAKSR